MLRASALLALWLMAWPHPLTGQTTDRTAGRERVLEMFARAYFPARTGHLFIVPRPGDIITQPEPTAVFMHGSPWPYDTEIPLLFVGPAVVPGSYDAPAAQRDVAPTLGAALGVRLPPTATGRVLPVLRPNGPRPRVVMLLVLDGMRRDYFDRYADSLPTLSALRRRGAWFSRAAIDVLPTNTAVAHTTLATGADPRVHGISATNFYDQRERRRLEMYAGREPRDLMALALADVWQLETSGRAVILAQGSVDRAVTPLAGHGACQVNGGPVVMVSYDASTGGWGTNPRCFRLPEYLAERNARTLWPAGGTWMGHRIDSPGAVRYSGLFPRFEADAMIVMMEREPLGRDSVPDLVLMNYKAADYVGHKHGPDSGELRTTLAEMDRHLARMLAALEARVGNDYLLAVTADHGMPAEPPSPDRRHMTGDIVAALHQRFDPAGQLVTVFEPENLQIFVDEARLASLGVTLRDMARLLESQPWVFAAFTRDEVRRAAEGSAPGRFVGAILANPRFQWRRVTSPHFRVYASEGSTARDRLDTLAQAAEAARRAVLARLGEPDSAHPDRADLFFVESPEDIRAVVGRPAGGWTEPEANALLMTVTPTGRAPMRHELAHLYSHRSWGRPAAPWLSEGVAVDGVGHCAGAPLHRWAAAVARAGLATPLLSLEANFDYSRAAPHLEAASFVGFIRDRYGIAALRMIWEHGLAAAERATGTPVAAVEAAWRAEVSRHGGPESAGLDPRGRVSCE